MTIGWHFNNTYSKLSETFKENIIEYFVSNRHCKEKVPDKRGKTVNCGRMPNYGVCPGEDEICALLPFRSTNNLTPKLLTYLTTDMQTQTNTFSIYIFCLIQIAKKFEQFNKLKKVQAQYGGKSDDAGGL